MFYEWVNGERRQPVASGERTICRQCNGELTGVLPQDREPFWRHMSRKDCDTWSEPEGDWHLAWKERFPIEAREFPMVDKTTGERHRADVFVTRNGERGVTVELQHSSISAVDVNIRERFYGMRGPMLWVVHLHEEAGAFHKYAFTAGLGGRPNHVDAQGRTFVGCRWVSRSSTFITKWKRSGAHVVFDVDGHLFYLATESDRTPFARAHAKDEFAVMPLTNQQFMDGVTRMLSAA